MTSFPADRIDICGVEAYGYHGVFPDEKEKGQKFLVDASVWTDFTPAAGADNIHATISYVDIADIIVRRVTGEGFDLIESLAHAIAADIHRIDGVLDVTVTVHKPYAPIAHPFSDVRVTARRPLNTFVVGAGSNLENPAGQVRGGLAKLADHARVQVLETSPLYATAPWGVTDQPEFRNAVARFRSSLTPLEFLQVCQGIEAGAARTRSTHWGPRTLDLDVLACYPCGEDAGVSSQHRWGKELILPHPHAHHRAFVLVPWADIAPHDQLGGRTVTEWLADLRRTQPEEVAGVREA